MTEATSKFCGYANQEIFDQQVAKGLIRLEPCTICGVTPYHCGHFGAEGKLAKELGTCFTCAFWEIRARKGCNTVINGYIYSPGNGTTGPHRGMAGRRFDIEYFAGVNAGKTITTFDLWGGGEIPERFRERLPDTAKFLGGATKAQVGDITCFNPSDPKADKYPSPSAAGIKP